jgi:hypothetical protein
MAELQCPQISSLRERMGRAGSEASEVGLAAVASVFPKFYAVMSEHDEAEAPDGGKHEAERDDKLAEVAALTSALDLAARTRLASPSGLAAASASPTLSIDSTPAPESNE